MCVVCLRYQHMQAHAGVILSLHCSFLTFLDTWHTTNLVTLWSPYKQVAFEIIFTCSHTFGNNCTIIHNISTSHLNLWCILRATVSITGKNKIAKRMIRTLLQERKQHSTKLNEVSLYRQANAMHKMLQNTSWHSVHYSTFKNSHMVYLSTSTFPCQ